MRPVAKALVLCLLWPCLVVAQSVELDEQRSAWRWRRGVALPAGTSEGAFAALTVPPEVVARSQPDLRDVRLLGADGAELPYVVDRIVERQATRSWAGRLVDTRREPLGPAAEGRGRSVWVVDLGEARSFDAVTLAIDARDFAKRVRLEASLDASGWRVLREDAAVFEAPWTPRVRHTTISLGEREPARYLRLTLDDDRRSPAVRVSGVSVSLTQRGAGEEWTRPVSLTPLGRKVSVTRYRLEVPASFPLETLHLEVDDPAFARRVRVVERRGAGSQPEERALAEGLLYRVKLADPAFAGECLTLAVAGHPRAGELLLEVDDRDSPPLRRPRVSVSGAAVRLLFVAGAGSPTLYYGNDVTRAPLYDLGPLREQLALAELALAQADPEAENPRFRKAAPLPFTAARGARVEVHRWKSVRKVTLEGHEDLYALLLAPEDLAALRPDLGDLRIVDDADLQLPYILEPAVAEARLALAVEHGDRPRSGERSVSRYRLLLREPSSGKPLSLPLAALELDFRETFFDRRATLRADTGGRRGTRTLFSGRLSRMADSRSSQPAPAAPIALSLDGPRVSELQLEVDEGDNAPLTLAAARVVVRVPRVTLKAAPGTYRVLLGQRDAQAPRYDLASLRQEVLAYSALSASATPAETNPAFRRFAADYFSDAPPTLLLWGTLLGAIVVLLLLTARAIRQPQG